VVSRLDVEVVDLIKRWDLSYIKKEIAIIVVAVAVVVVET